MRVVQADLQTSFDPTDWRGDRGSDNPYFRFVAAAEKMRLKYDIQDDSFQVFFPPTTTNHPNGAVMSVLLGTSDGESWYVAAEHEKTGRVLRPIPAFSWPLAKIGQEAERWMKTWGISDHTPDMVHKYLELVQ